MVGVALVTVSDSGIGVERLNTSFGRLTTPFAGTRNGSDSPEIVSPSMMQVARARTRPKFAGTFGSTHDPSACTRALRLRTLTTQFSLTSTSGVCARAGAAASRHTAAPIRRRTAAEVRDITLRPLGQ